MAVAKPIQDVDGAKQYLLANGVHVLFEDLAADVINARPGDPLVFLRDRIAALITERDGGTPIPAGGGTGGQHHRGSQSGNNVSGVGVAAAEAPPPPVATTPEDKLEASAPPPNGEEPANSPAAAEQRFDDATPAGAPFTGGAVQVRIAEVVRPPRTSDRLEAYCVLSLATEANGDAAADRQKHRTAVAAGDGELPTGAPVTWATDGDGAVMQFRVAEVAEAGGEAVALELWNDNVMANGVVARGAAPLAGLTAATEWATRWVALDVVQDGEGGAEGSAAEGAPMARLMIRAAPAADADAEHEY